MLSKFNQKANNQPKGYQTDPLKELIEKYPKYLHKMALISAHLKIHYLTEPYYKFKVEKGSIGFIHKNHDAVKLWIDSNWEVFSLGFPFDNMDPESFEDPCIFLGFEADKFNPYTRRLVRSHLRKNFKHYYIHPCHPLAYETWRQYFLLPQYKHIYDILVIPEIYRGDDVFMDETDVHHKEVLDLTEVYKKEICMRIGLTNNILISA